MQVNGLTNDSLIHIELYISRKKKLNEYLSLSILNTDKRKMFLLVEDENGELIKKIVYNEENEFESMVESMHQSIEDFGSFSIELEE